MERGSLRPVLLRAITLLGLALAACSTPIDGPCCPRGTDGRCVQLPVSTTNRRIIQLGSPECEQQVCVSEPAASDGGVLSGYCSVPCGAMGECPTGSMGALRCDPNVPASDGGTLSICVRGISANR
ncbi:MAG: hypothetical protein SFW67_11680 [Myxococcaceae bacterium]|nr:hypothetical protein [Myxococcaceae bacterium]